MWCDENQMLWNSIAKDKKDARIKSDSSTLHCVHNVWRIMFSGAIECSQHVIYMAIAAIL